jgi:hypothetical protein
MEAIAAQLCVFSGSKFFPEDGFNLRERLQLFLGCIIRPNAAILSESTVPWKRLRDLQLIDHAGFVKMSKDDRIPAELGDEIASLIYRVVRERRFQRTPVKFLRSIYELRRGGESLQYSDASQFTL